MFEFLTKGGFFIYPILFCSVLSLAIFLDKVWILRKKRVMPRELLLGVEDFVKRGQILQAESFCRQNDTPMARILISGLRHVGKSKGDIKEDMEKTGRKEVAEMEKYLEAVATVAAISPLLGLLGTVSGMIKAFSVISLAGVGNPSILAGGIAEALIATAAGLSVAVPSYVAYKYLIGKTDSYSLQMEQKAADIIDLIGEGEIMEEKL